MFVKSHQSTIICIELDKIDFNTLKSDKPIYHTIHKTGLYDQDQNESPITVEIYLQFPYKADNDSL